MILGYYIYKKISFHEGDGLTIFHAEMFHGTGKRYGADYPLMEYKYGNDLEYPLCVCMNVYNHAKIFMPNLSLVVSEDIKRVLEKTPNIDFNKVDFEKLFFYQYEKNASIYPSSAEKIIKKQKHDPSFVTSIGKYYELIVPMYDDIKDMFDGKETFIISGYDISTVEVEISKDMFKQYPIFWEDSIFINIETFKLIESYLNKDFFECVKIEV